MAGARFLFFARGGSGVSWRLVASNNREIARSPTPVVDLQAVAVEVDAMRRLATDAVTRLVREPATPEHCAGWRWLMEAEHGVIAVGSRSYHRRLECEFALTQFRVVAPTAEALLVVRSRV